jgi:hypothetical protein
MTKAVLCVHCSDIVSPYRAWQTDRSWRWCQCGHTGTRWRDGERGLLEVTGLHGPDDLRVIGLNNTFLAYAVATRPPSQGGWTDAEWRDLHDACAEQVGAHYLFHRDKRNCWALVVRQGESGDTFFIDYPSAKFPAARGAETAEQPGPA